MPRSHTKGFKHFSFVKNVQTAAVTKPVWDCVTHLGALLYSTLEISR